MDPIQIVGVIIGAGGAITSAISSSSMFFTKEEEDRVKDNAEGPAEKRKAQIADEDLARRSRVQDRFKFTGVICMLAGAGLAFAPMFV